MKATTGIDKPTQREVEMVKMIAAGTTGEEMAESIGTTVSKMNIELMALRLRYGCRNSAQLVAVFYENKFLK